MGEFDWPKVGEFEVAIGAQGLPQSQPQQGDEQGEHPPWGVLKDLQQHEMAPWVWGGRGLTATVPVPTEPGHLHATKPLSSGANRQLMA